MKSYTEKDGYFELKADAKKRVILRDPVITGQTIEDVIITALEGGIDYWAMLNCFSEEWNDRPDDMPSSMFATSIILEGGGIILADIEDPVDEYFLTLEKLVEGIEKACECSDITLDDIDSAAADVIIQMALFGDVIIS